ncbi:MAG: S-methyl-5-thioribose-1-phosphate isomerase [Chloroflexota bacterium]|nr:S-methyl-5-thioribose-1-phosphate isomerase [Dehalococcoidia bacterium]MDW8252584.1 S-methyl-5-thioribose-1-phosphate isomerase [Chloroflexota bacterium]
MQTTGRREQTVSWRDGRVRLIDQTRLPHEVVWLEFDDDRALGDAIREMRVRGAPAIGAAAAFGLALAARASRATTAAALRADLAAAADRLRATRPTAVNLFWAIDRVLAAAVGETPDAVRAAVLAEAQRIAEEDIAACRAIGERGAALLPDGATVLTHCNAGALATVDYGTALGIIRAGWEQGKVRRVFVDETRPLLQGARLTAWELAQDGIPLTLITDTMAGYFLRQGAISAVIVGADRVAANGDVANKIGTYTLAVLAKENGVPFYVAAPTSTIDLATPSGDAIPIEQRRPEEVTSFGGCVVAPAGVDVANPAFDVTPYRYVSAIVTEVAVLRPPFEPGLRAAVAARSRKDGR